VTVLRASAVPFVAGGAEGASRQRDFAAAGGLVQFGVFEQLVPPGARTSDRHWHDSEDEFVLVLEGTPTLVDDAGPQPLGPGDFVGWRAGVANAHQILNDSDRPVRLLVAGPRVARDVCRYPGLKRTLTNTDTTWAVTDDVTGAVLRGGDLPPHLMNLPPRWGITDAPPPPPLVRRGTARPDRATPQQAAYMGEFTAELLSDSAGLTQFGAFTETLMPGARSSDRHWHENEDEFLYLLAGAATVVEDDGPHALAPGDACTWRAGVANGHHVVNRSGAPCTYLVIGIRAPADVVHYSDVDKLYVRRADGSVSRTRRDGSPLEAPR
jgi:uncharacterized cupin superfamily protein